jgi:hypothetical protein
MNRQFASSLFSGSAFGVVLVTFLSCTTLCAIDELEKEKEEAQRAQGLKNMQRSAASYALASDGAPKRAFKFHETPSLRFSNAVGETKDGALYLWTDYGRPQAILKLYTFNNKNYSHAWLSLSESNFVAERYGKAFWSPSEPGIALREVPDAPKPAETAEERLRQMKTLAAKFSATYTALRSDGKPFELRILTQPLLRYQTDDHFRADGALYAYVQSTAPVGLLLLESRQISNDHRWHYAFASLTSGLVTARYGDKEVFSLERGNTYREPKQPYLLLHSLPVPKD